MLGRPILERLGHIFRAAVLRAARPFPRWGELAAQRRALRALDDHLLADIGVSRAQVLEAAQRRFWEDPLDARPPRDRAAGASSPVDTRPSALRRRLAG